jgi:TrmH family RNA methyltransferase
MKEITSVANEEIKSVTALQQAKYRQEKKQFIAEGIRTIQTLLESGLSLDMLYVLDDKKIMTHVQKLVDNQYITKVSSTVMNKISTAATPSGIVAVFKIPSAPSLEQLNKGLILAHIADPGNMGTLIRSCVAMNITTVVAIEGVDPWNPKVIQATAGTIGYVDLFQLSWQEILRYKHNLKLCALVVSGGQKPEQLTLDNSLLIVGSEAHGIPPAWLEQCDLRMTIPMPGKAESLNAAVAGSIALYLAFVQ